MIISDINYLEVVDANEVEGGAKKNKIKFYTEFNNLQLHGSTQAAADFDATAAGNGIAVTGASVFTDTTSYIASKSSTTYGALFSGSDV